MPAAPLPPDAAPTLPLGVPPSIFPPLLRAHELWSGRGVTPRPGRALTFRDLWPVIIPGVVALVSGLWLLVLTLF